MQQLFMDLNLLKTFSKVAELGSFTKAAEILKQPKSRVSRSVTRLENKLNVQLLNRTTRVTSLTSSGQKLFSKLSTLIYKIEDELTGITNQNKQMSGKIKITTSQDVSQKFLTKIILEYRKLHPHVVFETIITNEFLDLNKENIDIAFRAGNLKDSSLIQKKFIKTKFILVCSKEYLIKHNQPKKINQLVSHNFLSFKGFEKNFFKNQVSLDPTITTDSLAVLFQLVLENEGIAAMPSFFCKEAIQNGKLIHLIPSWKSEDETINIIFPGKKNISTRVKLFIELASKLFS
jgi:LysR family transcriptional regulator for bpeEF and oprC